MTDLLATDLKDHVILLDIDGTLIPDSGSAESLTDDLRTWVHALQAQNEVYLCSNKKLHARNKEIALVLGVCYIETEQRKPARGALGTLRSMKPYAVIGDKFITDGLFARNLGARFVKVKRIVSPHDTFAARLSYRFDDLVYAMISAVTTLLHLSKKK